MLQIKSDVKNTNKKEDIFILLIQSIFLYYELKVDLIAI